MTLLQHHVIALGLTAITTLGLGLLAFLSEPRRRLNQVFGLYSLGIAVWAFGESFVVGAENLTIAAFFAYLEWIGIIFIAPTFLHTILLLTDEPGRSARFTVGAAYVVSIVLLAGHAVFNAVTTVPRPISYTKYFAGSTVFGLLVPLVFFILVNVALGKLALVYRRSAGQRRTQLGYLLWASVLGYLGGSPDWFLNFGFSVPGLNPFGIYCIPLYSIATAYAILHHRLFDVHLVIRKSLVYSTVVTLLTIGYFGTLYGVERFCQVAFRYDSLWMSLAAFAIMALVFQPLKIAVQRLVDLALLGATRQGVARRLESLEHKVREGERYKTVATLAAGIAHELNNPLASIKIFLEFFPKKHDDAQFRQQFQAIVGSEIDRLQRVAQGLLDFSKPQVSLLRPIDVTAVLEDVMVLTRAELASKSVTVHTTYAHNGSVVLGDATQLKQAFLNLILNARDAMERGGALTIFTASVDGQVEVHVADTGGGMHPKDIPHLFEPFFSRKPDGHGLGLSIVQNIIREHHGTVSVQSTPGRGTIFIVRLPL